MDLEFLQVAIKTGNFKQKPYNFGAVIVRDGPAYKDGDGLEWQNAILRELI